MSFSTWYSFYRQKGFGNRTSNDLARLQGDRTRGTRFQSSGVNRSARAMGSGSNVRAGRRWEWGWGSGGGTGYNVYTKYKGNRP